MLILEAASTSRLAGGVSFLTVAVAMSGIFGTTVDFTNGEGVLDFCATIEIQDKYVHYTICIQLQKRH